MQVAVAIEVEVVQSQTVGGGVGAQLNGAGNVSSVRENRSRASLRWMAMEPQSLAADCTATASLNLYQFALFDVYVNRHHGLFVFAFCCIIATHLLLNY